ncbi:hypothetical protein [Streptomyces hydrogenans]|uniref:hypothetical protein n=1 Tax=Streptomyces hydrogenans TaxID=1873719 RepID=UPI003811A21C
MTAVNAVHSSTRSGRTEAAAAGRIRTCRPAVRETVTDPPTEAEGPETDPEPQIVRGED